MTSKPYSHWLACPVCFIVTQNENQRDIMTATAMFVSEHESRFVVSLDKKHLTSKIIEQTKEFILCPAGAGQEGLAIKVGSTRGDTVDKFEKFSIETTPTLPGQPDIPTGAAAWLLCRVIQSTPVGDYVLYIAEAIDGRDFDTPALIWRNMKMGAFTAD